MLTDEKLDEIVREHLPQLPAADGFRNLCRAVEHATALKCMQLKSNGTTLELAVHFCMRVDIERMEVGYRAPIKGTAIDPPFIEHINPHLPIEVAVRRAVVRAAANIARAKRALEKA